MIARDGDDDPPGDDFRVGEVQARRDRSDYLSLAREVYRGAACPTPHAVASLEALLRRRSLLAERTEVRALIAREGTRPVAALMAMLQRHPTSLGRRIGTIGFLEARRGRDLAVDALFREAESWLAERGAVEIHGPVNGLAAYASGCLDNRHDEPPAAGMAHNPPWYSALWWSRGYRPAPTRYAYAIDLAAAATHAAVERMLARRSEVTLRAVAPSTWRAELEAYADLARACHADDPSHVGVARDEVAEILGPAARSEDAELLVVAERSGRAVGFVLATADEGGTRGWRRCLGLGAPPRRAVVWDIGVMPEERRRGIGSALVARVLARMVARGMSEAVVHPVAAGDEAMRRLLRGFGAEPTRTYLHFVKTLG